MFLYMFVLPSFGIGVDDIGGMSEVGITSTGSFVVIVMLSEVKPIVAVVKKLVVGSETLLRIVDDTGSVHKTHTSCISVHVINTV